MSEYHPHRMKPLPSVEYLKERLVYRDGMLFWQKRPRGDFRTQRACSVWNARYGGKRAGCPMTNGYRLICLNEAKFLEHRVIFHMVKEPLTQFDYVDHRDTDHTNNHDDNLRKCTHAQNLKNQPARQNALPKHVCWSKRERKYKVGIRSDGVHHFIGTFADLGDAARAAEEASKRLHGEFRNTVVPV